MLMEVRKMINYYKYITKNGLKRIEEFKVEWREVMSIYQFVTKGE